jgi:Phage gp6-like head-tail connector protein
MLVELDTLKLHCRVDSNDEDTIITIYGEAADERVMSYLGRNVYTTQVALTAAVTAGTAGDDPMVVNDSIKASIMLLVGHLYSNRESTVDPRTEMVELPMGVSYLLTPYRMGMGI